MAAAFAAAVLVLLLCAGGAAADDDLKIQSPDGKVPAGYELSVGKVKRITAKAPAVEAQKKLHKDLHPTAYTRKQGDWQVSWFSDGKEYVQLYVSDDTGRVTESWTGPQIAWKMARGYPGAFGRKVNAWYVWLPLCLLFVAPFVDPRRPFRMIHLDLLVIVVGFGISHYFFNRGEIDIAVPLVYPALLYLLARGLWLGFRPTETRERLVPLVPITWLVVALLFLVGLPDRPERGGLERDRRGLCRGDRGGPDHGRRRDLRQGLQQGRGQRRYLWARQLPGLRPVRTGRALDGQVG